MIPKYRFYLQLDGGDRIPVTPVYADDLAIDYELESEERFYRQKLSGNLLFLRDDFKLINEASIETTFTVTIQKSSDFGISFSDFFIGKFSKTNCTINLDDQSVKVQPEMLDQYNEVLDGLEKEYDLIQLKPQMQQLIIQKRPLIQVYIPGDDVVSCFLSGMHWEQSAVAIDDEEELVNTYYFAKASDIVEVEVSALSGAPSEYAGVYVGKVKPSSNPEYIAEGEFRSSTKNYYVKYTYLRRQDGGYVKFYTFIDGQTGEGLYSYEGVGEIVSEQVQAQGVGTAGALWLDVQLTKVYMRYLCDVDQIEGEMTYPIPADDIVDENRNYRRVIGYAFDLVEVSETYSTKPTEYGLADNGKYFAPPYSIGQLTYYPIAQSTWRYTSLWFMFSMIDPIFEKSARKTYILRNVYQLSSCINVLLNKIAPGITHAPSSVYSQFLYGDPAPVASPGVSLSITPKDNILSGNYQSPVQTAKITLRTILDMFRNVYKCYWYIEAGKLKIEHVQWFRNGGSYYNNTVVGTDLTDMYNPRNGKKWAFGTSEFSFEKADMPERYEFSWMDEVTEQFTGQPIEVKSRYVSEGDVESVTIANFTSDIDYMLLNPGDISSDGFALLGGVMADAIADTLNYGGYIETAGSSTSISTPKINIRPDSQGSTATLKFMAIGEGVGQVEFYNESGYVKSGPSFTIGNKEMEVSVQIPDNATMMAFSTSGTITARVYSMKISGRYELPFAKITIDRVNYELQNGYLAYEYLHPLFWIYDMPARNLEINGQSVSAQSIQKSKKQTLKFPLNETPNPMKLIKTYIGEGQVEKMSVNLSSQIAEVTLKYDPE